MKNLYVYFQKCYEQVAPDVEASALVSIPFEQTDFLLSKDGRLFQINTETDNVENEFDCTEVVEAENPTLKQTYEYCFYLAEAEILFCATKEGTIFMFDLNTYDITVSGDIESGIATLEWSPDQEYAVVLSNNGSILLMNSMCEVLYESTIQSMDPTQDITMSWRGDNEFFALNFIDINLNSRVIYIFNKELQLHAKARDFEDHLLPAILPALSWSPDGSLLGTMQCIDNKYRITLIEVNGYKHKEYILQQYSNFQPLSLSWSCQSSYIGLLYSHGEEGNNEYAMNLYTRDNYQLFLKYSSICSSTPLSICFDSINDLEFKLLFKDTSYIHYICSSQSTQSNDYSSVIAVTDGTQLHLTPLQLMIPAPPTSAHTIVFPDEINCVSFRSDLYNEYIPLEMVAISSRYIYLCKIKDVYNGPDRNTIEGSKELASIPTYQLNRNCLTSLQSIYIDKIINIPDDYISMIYSPLYINTSYIFMIVSSPLSSSSSLLCYNIIEDTFDMFTPDFSLFQMAYRDNNNLLLEDLTGNIYIYNIETKEVKLRLTLPTPCPILYNIYTNNTNNNNNMDNNNNMNNSQQIDVITALDANYKLYINETLISSSVTHLIPLPSCDALLYIKSLSPPRLCFIPYSQLLSPQLNTEGVPIESLYSRAIERGSTFIGLGAHDGRVILQMPRGNFECIYPRYMSIHILLRLYEQQEFGIMIEKMRREKIPFDLLYDYNPGNFATICPLILHALSTVNRISLIVSNIAEKDLLSAGNEYASISKPKNYIPPSNGNKRDIMCDTLFQSIQKIEEGDESIYKQGIYLEEKITCLIHKVIPDISGCLTLIKSYMSINRERGEEGLSWMIVLTDVKNIYNTCLSLYDIPLCLLIATKAQMDPREYKPFLQGLYDLDDIHQHYQIDKYLHNTLPLCKDIYNILLTDIQEEEKESFATEMISICKENTLYKECLELYKNTSYKDRILKEYANYLVSKGLYSAYDCALKNGKGIEAINILYLSGMTKEELKPYIFEICNYLRDGAEPEIVQAAEIYCEYLHDIDRSVALYIQTKHYFKAYNVCNQNNRQDLLETDLYIAVKKSIQPLLQEFTDKVHKMTQCRDRLIEIQKDKVILEEQKEEDGMSIWSGATGMTGITAISGMTTLLSSADPSLPDTSLNINKLRELAPVGDLNDLGHRAAASDSRNQRNSRMMSFGGKDNRGNGDNGNNKKNKNKQEEDSLRVMVDIIKHKDMNRYEEEVKEIIHILLYIKEYSLILQLQTGYDEYVSSINHIYAEIPEPSVSPATTTNNNSNNNTNNNIEWKQDWIQYL
ncbi:hypothetical protein WA158_002799 [Blastocystis sp. Blastoise]